MLNFPAIGVWHPGQIAISWTQSSRQIVPQVEQQIEQEWTKANQRRDVLLFDGPLCRLEEIEATAQKIHLTLSRSNYKIFVGTNAAGEPDPHVRANPVGVSSLLITADDFLLMGRRNSRVAMYPDHVHPFAGSMEPADKLDAFEEACRELEQELSIAEEEIEEISCIGIAQEPRLNHIELVFAVRVELWRAQVESRLDKTEHRGIWSSMTSQSEVELAMQSAEQFTPFARSALLLWGRLHFGDKWFEKHRQIC